MLQGEQFEQGTHVLGVAVVDNVIFWVFLHHISVINTVVLASTPPKTCSHHNCFENGNWCKAFIAANILASLSVSMPSKLEDSEVANVIATNSKAWRVLFDSQSQVDRKILVHNVENSNYK
jgi:hypothetical protein